MDGGQGSLTALDRLLAERQRVDRLRRSRAERLQQLCIESGVPARVLAQRTGLSYSFVKYIYRGERGMSDNTALRIADALGVDTDDLFDLDRVDGARSDVDTETVA